MMLKYFIKNGRVISPDLKTDEKVNVLLDNGKITEITSTNTVPSGYEVIDAGGCIVSPGFIDMHVHLRDPGQEYKEDIESGTRAAAAGGFTTICPMPNTNPTNDCASVTEYVMDRARLSGVVNVLPIGAISRGRKGEALADIGDMAASGVIGLSDDGSSVASSLLLRRAMEYASNFDLLIISHCEDASLVTNGVMNEGALSTKLGLLGMPATAEETIVARDIALAGLTGARLHIAHVSAAGTLKHIRQAKKEGIRITAEVTPHHLTLTEEACADYDPNTKVNPPLRTEADREALIAALADGTIDCVATDHAPHNITEKEMGFQGAAFGMVGLETALPLILKLVSEKKITIQRMIEVMSVAPAKILGLASKGRIKVGADANIVIFDPKEAWTIKASNFASKSRNTPFDGMRVLGRVKKTIVGGCVVYSS